MEFLSNLRKEIRESSKYGVFPKDGLLHQLWKEIDQMTIAYPERRGSKDYIERRLEFLEQQAEKEKVSIGDYFKWRANRKDKCYCGHTDTCDCSDPDLTLFRESVERGTIELLKKQEENALDWLQKTNAYKIGDNDWGSVASLMEEYVAYKLKG